MRLTKIPFEETKAFAPFFLDYIHQQPSLQSFYDTFPAPENFNISLTKKKSFPKAHRDTLVSVLREQYRNTELTSAVSGNIDALRHDSAFTITTGHQLNIFTGPLYFIYKIVTVINACKKLSELHPDKKFVPVYWMASEDHDYDEIKSFRLYGTKYTWETKQQGAVGRFHTEEFKSLLEKIPGDADVFKRAYSKHKKLADAVREYVNELFGAYGVVVVDGDHAALKKEFVPVIHEDVIQHSTVNLVNATNQKLEQLNYKTQVFCRDINFFYLEDNLRSRIERKGDGFVVLDTNLTFTAAEMQQLIDEHPERFSPNVILRPLYQEIILPNLAYCGGPAEMVYWLQLKSVFDHHHIPFPILLPRNFALVIEHHVDRKLEKTGVPLTTYFEEKNFIFNSWVLAHSAHQLTVGEERDKFIQLFAALKERAENLDKSLGQFVGAENQRALNSLEKIERKMLRAGKRIHQEKLGQIEAVKNALFPNGGLQERVDNFLNFYQQDKDFIAKLITHLDPFDFRFHVLTYRS